MCACMCIFKYTFLFLFSNINPLKKPPVSMPDLWCSRCWAAGGIGFLEEGGFVFLILQPQSDCSGMLKGKMNGVPYQHPVLHISTCLLTFSVCIKGLEYINIIFRCLFFGKMLISVCQMAEERAVCALC